MSYVRYFKVSFRTSRQVGYRVLLWKLPTKFEKQKLLPNGAESAPNDRNSSALGTSPLRNPISISVERCGVTYSSTCFPLLPWNLLLSTPIPVIDCHVSPCSGARATSRPPNLDRGISLSRSLCKPVCCLSFVNCLTISQEAMDLYST